VRCTIRSSVPRLVTVAVVAASLAALAGTAAAQLVLPREIRQRILEAVVELRALDPAVGNFVAAGSGTIISPDGFVLTNFHVVGDLESGRAFEWHAVFVTDPTAPDQAPAFRYWARYVAGDARHDLALVQIVEDAEERPLPAGLIFASMPVGDSNGLIPGDPLTVVGYPGISGTTITFTAGIVSGFLGEDLAAGGKQWIKTDAKLARGNSGGAAFDEHGVLVAIPTLRYQTTDGQYIEQQDYLRPIALAWPLISQHVPTVTRVGGAASALAERSAAPTAPAGGGGGGALGGLAPQRDPFAATPAATPTHTMAEPRVERGVLTAGDPTLAAGEHFHVYEVDAVAGQALTIDLRSVEFDAYLIVVDANQDVLLDIDDSAGAGTNVLETVVPERSERLYVVVTSYGAGETGAYEVRLTGMAPSGPVSVATPAVEPETIVATLPFVHAGTLTGSDFALPSGEHVDTFLVDVVAGHTVSVELRSSDFDVFLVVLAPDDSIALEVDDSADQGFDVVERFVARSTGTYLVAVTSAFAGATGPYELRIAATADPFAAPTAGLGALAATTPGEPAASSSASGIVGPLALGGVARGELAANVDAVAYHTYMVTVPPGHPPVIVEMTADADLDLYVKFGSEIGDLGTNGDWDLRDIELAHGATLTIDAPRAGIYYVDVVWILGEGTARYTLRAR
jgi:S1-C subfamily serine protease